VAAYLLGIAGMAVLTGYVVVSGLGLWPRGEPGAGPLPWLVDTGWLAAFALQHSGMAREGFKQWLTGHIPAYLERSIYVAASGVLTLAQPLIWQPLPGDNVWEGQYWLMAVSIAGVAGLVMSYRWFDQLSFLGLRQVGIGGAAAAEETVRMDGPYRWVRHPLMVAMLMFLWGQPTMPPELLLLVGGLTAYILVAIRLEERELRRKFGQVYEDYCRRVPALVPWRLPV
jgi:protein-S-isoprenylcysteine O-methyltransferase Ste14